MRPTQVSLSAAGNSPLVFTDYQQTPFDLSIAVICSSGATLSYQPQVCIDDPSNTWDRNVIATQATTVITVTNDFGPPGNGNTHGLSVADIVQLKGTQGNLASGVLANIDGLYPVATIVSATSYTLTSPTSQTFTAGPDTKAQSFRVFPAYVAVVGGTTARTLSSYTVPISAVRLVVSAYTSGTCTMVLLQGMEK